MRTGRGQAVVEVALVLPLLFTIGLGAVELARLADARAGLDAATAAAVSSAARAQSASSAQTTAQATFQASVAGYPLASPRLVFDPGAFQRGGTLTAIGVGGVDLGMAPVPGLPRAVWLTSVASGRVAPWRSR